MYYPCSSRVEDLKLLPSIQGFREAPGEGKILSLSQRLDRLRCRLCMHSTLGPQEFVNYIIFGIETVFRRWCRSHEIFAPYRHPVNSKMFTRLFLYSVLLSFEKPLMLSQAGSWRLSSCDAQRCRCAWTTSFSYLAYKYLDSLK